MLLVTSAWRRECSLLHVTAVSLALVEFVLDFGRRCTVIFGAHCVGHGGPSRAGLWTSHFIWTRPRLLTWSVRLFVARRSHGTALALSGAKLQKLCNAATLAPYCPDLGCLLTGISAGKCREIKVIYGKRTLFPFRGNDSREIKLIFCGK
jgi:hypothetical protein